MATTEYETGTPGFKIATTISFTTENVTLNNTEQTTAGQPKRDETLARDEVILQAVIFSLAVLGNGMVLVVLALRRKKLSRMNTLIVHLCIADLFVAFCNVFPQLMWDVTHFFRGGPFLCGTVKFLQVMAIYASTYVLVVTAIDRYLAICHPLTAQTWSIRKVHIMVGVAWLLSALFSIPQPIIFRWMHRGGGAYDCWAIFEPMWTATLYVTWFFCAVYLVPFLLLAFCYGRISFVVWRSMSKKESSNDRNKSKRNDKGRLLKHSAASNGTHNSCSNPRAHVRGSMSKAKVKTVKMTLTVVLCYVLCWSPFFIAQMWAAWDYEAPLTSTVFTICMLLASLNSCTNPLIYMAYSDVLCRSCRRVAGRRGRFDMSSYDSEGRTKMSVMSTTEMPRFERVSFSHGKVSILDRDMRT